MLPWCERPLQKDSHVTPVFCERKPLTQTTLELKEALLWASLNFVPDPGRKMKKYAIEEGCVLVGSLKHASLHLVYLFCCFE